VAARRGIFIIVKKRPINLDLFAVRFPMTAIVSLMHRLSGIFLFFMIPVLLWVLQDSLSDTGFADWEHITRQLWCKGLIWFILSALFYHLLAGLRHMVMDMAWLDSFPAATVTAKAVLILSIIYSIAVGLWLWF
jgi:succinate dehydrogenase cytochrome b subunit